MGCSEFRPNDRIGDGLRFDALRAGTPTAELEDRVSRFKKLTQDYLATFPETERQLEAWDYHLEVPLSESFSAFIFGRKWLTASFWQDWYGVVPLVVGSLMVSLVALVLAVPFGVGAAIYVNQIATEAERKFIKPCIEFISAIPSVVLGFFGIANCFSAVPSFENKSLT